MPLEIVQPAGWPRPRGYSNGVTGTGRVIEVAGQIGWNEREEFDTDDFAGQVRQALENVVTVLRAAGAGPEHITRMTWYILDRDEYLAAGRDIGAAYREVIGAHFPAMSAVQVVALIERRARVEIEVSALVPE